MLFLIYYIAIILILVGQFISIKCKPFTNKIYTINAENLNPERILYAVSGVLNILPSFNQPFLIYLVIVFLLFFAVFWNSRYGIGGIVFIPPLKNYLGHEQSNFDIFYARMSILLNSGLIVIIYFIIF